MTPFLSVPTCELYCLGFGLQHQAVQMLAKAKGAAHNIASACAGCCVWADVHVRLAHSRRFWQRAYAWRHGCAGTPVNTNIR